MLEPSCFGPLSCSRGEPGRGVWPRPTPRIAWVDCRGGENSWPRGKARVEDQDAHGQTNARICWMSSVLSDEFVRSIRSPAGVGLVTAWMTLPMLFPRR